MRMGEKGGGEKERNEREGREGLSKGGGGGRGGEVGDLRRRHFLARPRALLAGGSVAKWPYLLPWSESRSQPQRDVHARIGIWGLSYPQQEGDVPGRHIAGTHDSWFRNTQNTLANRIMLRWGRDPGDQEAWRKGQSCKGLARGSRQGLGTHRWHRLLFEECACNRLQQQASCTSTRELVSRHHSCEGTT